MLTVQKVILVFLPDVQKLMACGLDKSPKDESRSGEDPLGPVCAEQVRAEAEEGDAAVPLPTLSITPAHGTALRTAPCCSISILAIPERTAGQIETEGITGC